MNKPDTQSRHSMQRMDASKARKARNSNGGIRCVQRMVRAQRPITGTLKFDDVDDIARLCEPLPWHEYYEAGFIAGINACRELMIRNAP